jgi:ABC-2 type transport system ATP-binding protein
MDKDIAISVVGLSKHFKSTIGHGSIKQLFTNMFRKESTGSVGYQALQDINFEIKKGEFFGIVGRNGCGKSTLLKLIAGVYTPTHGQIKIEGRLVPLIELGVGFNPELSGKDNVYLNGSLLGFSRKEMDEMYDDIVEFAELENHMDVRLKNFSSGMQVRLAFSIAIRAKNDILLIDEVLAVGDSNFQAKCYEVFNKLKEEGRTIVFVTHNMSDVEKFCDRVLVIVDGKVAELTTPQKAKAKYFQLNDEQREKANRPKTSKLRWGSGDFYITKLEIIGENGRPIKQVKQGQRFGVQMEFKNNTLTSGESITVGVNIFGEKGENIYGPNSIGQKLNADTKKATLWFTNPNLNSGLFYISVAIFDKSLTKTVDHLDKSKSIRVTGETQQYGLTTTITEWN